MATAGVVVGGDMPYKSEHIPLSEKQDRRRKLTQEQKDEIVALYGTGLHSLRSLGRKFGVDKSYISILVNPERAEAVKNRIKEHWRDYKANKEDWAKIMQEHRQYKHSLYLKGELKMGEPIVVKPDYEQEYGSCEEYLTVGDFTPRTDDRNAVINREYYRQGWIFKSEEAFYEHLDKVCYVPELSETEYTRQDFLDLCNGREDFAKELFDVVDWQHPEVLLDEWFREGEWGECSSCGWLYSSYNVHEEESEPPICTKCGASLINDKDG
jgi:hypothetical protein